VDFCFFGVNETVKGKISIRMTESMAEKSSLDFCKLIKFLKISIKLTMYLKSNKIISVHLVSISRQILPQYFNDGKKFEN
jgi:hypothetical protein